MTNSSIWPIDGTLLGATIPGENEPGSNSNEGVLHIPQRSKSGTLPPDGFVSYPGHLFLEGVLPLCKDAVDIF